MALFQFAKEGENSCPSQVNIESRLNVMKQEIRSKISDTVNPFLDSSISCGGNAWTRVAYLNDDISNISSNIYAEAYIHIIPCGLWQ